MSHGFAIHFPVNLMFKRWAGSRPQVRIFPECMQTGLHWVSGMRLLNLRGMQETCQTDAGWLRFPNCRVVDYQSFTVSVKQLLWKDSDKLKQIPLDSYLSDFELNCIRMSLDNTAVPITNDMAYRNSTLHKFS